jgi:hypothetical protein
MLAAARVLIGIAAAIGHAERHVLALEMSHHFVQDGRRVELALEQQSSARHLVRVQRRKPRLRGAMVLA